MQAIATLLQDDPYLKLPAEARVAARRERRARIWASRELPAVVKLFPIVDSIPAPLLKRGDPPDYTCMWFHHLVFETEKLLPGIVARKTYTQRAPRIDEIQIECCKYFNVRRADLLSRRRTADIVRPRQVAYFLSKQLTDKSLPEIGRRFGGRDHTSVLSGLRKIERLRHTDESLQGDLNFIAATFEGYAI